MSLVAFPFQEVFDKPPFCLKKPSDCFVRPNVDELRLEHEINDEKLKKNFEKLLRIYKLGFQVKIFELEWYPCLVCAPVFHCAQCLSIWEETEQVPSSCPEEGQCVYGEMLAISGTHYRIFSQLLIKHNKKQPTTVQTKKRSIRAKDDIVPVEKSIENYHYRTKLSTDNDKFYSKAGLSFRKWPEKRKITFERTYQEGIKATLENASNDGIPIAEFVDLSEIMTKWRALYSPRKRKKATKLQFDLSLQSRETTHAEQHSVKGDSDMTENLSASTTKDQPPTGLLQAVSGERRTEKDKRLGDVGNEMKDKMKKKKEEERNRGKKKFEKKLAQGETKESSARRASYCIQNLDLTKSSKENIEIRENRKKSIASPKTTGKERKKRSTAVPSVAVVRRRGTNSRAKLPARTVVSPVLQQPVVDEFIELSSSSNDEAQCIDFSYQFDGGSMSLREFSYELSPAYTFSYFSLLKN